MDAEASPSRSISGHVRGALRLVRGAWSHAARLALDIALPTLCVACREPVNGEGVCADCWAKLSFIAPPYCPRLGIPFVYDPGPELLSMEAIANPPAYSRARAAVRYDDVARTLVHALKYQDRTDLAPAMGRWMARAGRDLLEEADALVPVPLHWRCGWSRRYNQSGALARVIERQTGVKLASEALRRVRPTQQQIGMARSERASNVQGAFKVASDRKADIAGRRVVLVDDVLTSGATVDACAPRRLPSTCWYSRGLWTPTKLPYSSSPSHTDTGNTRAHHDRRHRNLHPSGLRLLQRRQVAADTQKSRVHRIRCSQGFHISSEDVRSRRRRFDLSADFHRPTPCRRLRRALRAGP
jgi:ComF family protein